MRELISNLKEKILSEIKDSDKNTLEEIRIKYLGKKGEFTSILRNMANVSKEERPKIGELINQTKTEIENKINDKIEFFNNLIFNFCFNLMKHRRMSIIYYKSFNLMR